MNISKALLPYIALVLTLTPATSHAWSALGHQSVCDAAWQMSDSSTRRYLAKAAKRMAYRTFAESCVWADRVRKQEKYKKLSPLHYVNVPKSALKVDDGICEPRKTGLPRCVIATVDYYHQRLDDKRLSQRQRDEALLLLSHFVADIHQPLHVAYKEDRGGTRTNVVFEGKLQSLHRLWDQDIIRCEFKQGWRQLGKALYKENNKIKLAKTMDANQWANESLLLTRDIYQSFVAFLPETYCDDYHPRALKRLQLASYRLASLLNILEGS